MTAAETRARILRLMRQTGQPLDIRGTRTKRWCLPYGNPRIGLKQSGVSPRLHENPGAYDAYVGPYRVSIRAALYMLENRIVTPRRVGWRIRVRCDAAPVAGDEHA